MLSYFESALLFPQSFFFTLLIFAMLGIGFIFIVLFNVLAKQDRLVKRSKITVNIIKRVTHLLNKFTLISYDAKSAVLFEVMELLRNYFPGTTYKYDLPWTLLLGTSRSKQNDIVSSLQFKNTLGEFFSSDGRYAFICFGHGMIVDVKKKDDDLPDFLELITNHRTSIPFDSVTMTISIKEMLENTKDQNLLLARQWTKQVQEIYKITQMRLPVYVVFSDLDALEGFKAFADSLTAEQREEMFGWSSMYGLEQLPSNFADVMMEEVINRLLLVQQGLLSGNQEEAGRELEHVSFIESMYNFSEKIKHFLTYFNDVNKEVFIAIRGVYFVGEHNERVIFNTQLFEKKIFFERGITKRLKQQLFLKDYWIRLLMISVLGVGIYGAYLLFSHHTSLKASRYNELPKWQKFEILLKKYKNGFRGISNEVFVGDLSTFISTMRVMDNDWLLYNTIPSSLISNTWQEAEEVLVNLCQFLLINPISEHLDKKIKDFIKFNQRRLAHRQFDVRINVLSQEPEYKDFKRFVRDLAAYKRLSEKMDDLQYQNDLNDLNYVLKKLFNVRLGKALVEPDAYIKAIRRSIIKPIHWIKYEQDLLNLFKIKSGKLFDNVFNKEYMRSKLEPLTKELEGLTTQQTNLTKLKYELMSIIDWIETEVSVIFKGNRPRIGEDWLDFLKDLQKVSGVVGKFNVRAMYKELQLKMREMRSVLISAKLPIVGFLIVEDEEGNLTVSPELMKMLGLLNTLIVNDFKLYSEAEKPNLEPTKQELLASMFGVKVCALETASHEQNPDHKSIFNLNFDVLVDMVNKIDIFNTLHKENSNAKCKQSLYKTALLILSDEMLHKLVIPSKEVKKMNVSNVTGYVVRILDFAYKTNRGVYNQLLQALVNYMEMLLHDLHMNITEKSTFYRFSLEQLIHTKGNVSWIKQQFEEDTQRLKSILEPYAPLIELFEAVIKIDQEKDVMHSSLMQELVYIWKSIKQTKQKIGDLHVLQGIALKVFSSVDLKKASEAERWISKPGFFEQRFIELMTLAKEFAVYRRRQIFIEDYQSMKLLFNNKLSGKFPFASKGVAAEAAFEDVIAFYCELDNFLKRNSLEFLENNQDKEIVEMVGFVRNMIALRPWLENYAKNAASEFNLVVDMRYRKGAERMVDNVSQCVLALGEEKIDFRSKNMSVSLLPYETVSMDIDLSYNSNLIFNDERRNAKYVFEGKWALFRLLEHYRKTSDNELMISIPVYNDWGEKQILQFSFKVSLVNGRQYVPFRKLPVFAPSESVSKCK